MGDQRTCGTCACHTNTYTPCDIPGGCGTIGCGQTHAGTCTTCPVYRPDTHPRTPNHPPVCDSDRALMDRHLVEVANLHADLTNDEPALLDQRRYERFDRNGRTLGESPADPLTPLGGVAPINSRRNQPTVSGSRERPLPISADHHDLKAPARVPAPTWQARRWPGDQIGRLSTATTLDQWVRDWRDTLWPGHHLPPATVDQLTMWLRTRLHDACDNHPAINEFAAEVKTLRGALRAAAGDTEPKPEPCEGVTCRRCDHMTLYRQPGGDVTCVNPDCQAVLRTDEYHHWVKTLTAEAKIKRHTKQDA